MGEEAINGISIVSVNATTLRLENAIDTSKLATLQFSNGVDTALMKFFVNPSAFRRFYEITWLSAYQAGLAKITEVIDAPFHGARDADRYVSLKLNPAPDEIPFLTNHSPHHVFVAVRYTDVAASPWPDISMMLVLPPSTRVPAANRGMALHKVEWGTATLQPNVVKYGAMPIS